MLQQLNVVGDSCASTLRKRRIFWAEVV